jgi:hypothetical protein
MVNEGECVAVFHSIHRVMKAEKILQSERLDVMLIPTPRELTSDCGMALKYSKALSEAVASVLRQHGMTFEELWVFESGDFTLQV